jgi:hypothetical protein
MLPELEMSSMKPAEDLVVGGRPSFVHPRLARDVNKCILFGGGPAGGVGMRASLGELAMSFCRQLQFVVRSGKIAIDWPVGAARNESRVEARFFTHVSTRFAARRVTPVATIPHAFRHFSTMFLRASFARGKVCHGNRMRRWPRVRFVRQTARLWKNVEIRANRADAGGVTPSAAVFIFHIRSTESSVCEMTCLRYDAVDSFS